VTRRCAWIISRRSQPDSAELRAVVAGVLATPKRRECKSPGVGRTRLFVAGTITYNFSRNLAPDFTHYLSERLEMTSQ
jgi:hypothetical protein